MVFNIASLFCISNMNSKYRKHFFILTFTILLRQTLIKLWFYWNEISFYPLNIKIKPMLWSFILSLKQVCVFIISPISSFWTIFCIWIITICAYKISSKYMISIFFLISEKCLWLIWMLLKVLNKKFRKYFNLSKIRFINCHLDCPPCLLINFIDVLDSNIHSTKIFRCHMCVITISRNRNCHFRINTWLCTNILSITTRFLKNIFGINRFFNFIVVLIC